MTDIGPTPFGAVDISTDDDGSAEDDRRVLDILLDAAHNERKRLLQVLHAMAHRKRPCLGKAIRDATDPADLQCPQAVAETIATLLLTTVNTPHERAPYLELAERLGGMGLFDGDHFSGVVALLILDQGSEQGYLPADAYGLVEQHVTDHHPEWTDVLDEIESRPEDPKPARNSTKFGHDITCTRANDSHTDS